MTKLVFIKKEDKKGVFKLPRRTNYFLPKRRICPPKRGRMATLPFNPHWEMDKTFSPSYSSSQITYVEAEAVGFSGFRFHRKRTASSFRFHIPGLNMLMHIVQNGYMHAIGLLFDISPLSLITQVTVCAIVLLVVLVCAVVMIAL